ncbi:uncharacterized protein LOC130686761 [Daphnia carinata]|uniref:uncharacterized protein LOC130686761 n=1 Tax=Daphnia carinata TaxID=120202 RepID=UPI00257B7CBF|nr:uncharacterized protein LOC130686761 [Daphnia carinata]
MFDVRLYYCAALLSQLATINCQLVPYSGATRFVPNWWMAVHQAVGECRNSGDCSEGECCVRSTGSRQHLFCLPLRHLGEACRLRQTFTEQSNRIYLNLCPCGKGLICRESYTGWVDAECVSLRNPAELLRNSFLQAILKALEEQRQHNWQTKKRKIPNSWVSN